METDDLEENKHDKGGTLSLLTLADLAIALQDQGEDHTYAKNYDIPQVLDEQCLRGKEKDHNYSTCSRTELRGRAKYNMKRSSSEENLTTVGASENKSSSDDFSLISKKSHSCEQVVVAQNQGIPGCGLVVNEFCDASVHKLCCSWPKENTFKDFMTGSLPVISSRAELLWSQQTVCDHTYARDKNTMIDTGKEENFTSDIPINVISPDPLVRTEHNYDIREKFSFNDPQKMHSRKLKNSKYTSNNKQSEQALLNVMKNSRFNFDHNYTFRGIQSHQPSGSVESLDMDFSDSSTDSCEETVVEESKIYHAQMMNTQQDHPYSKLNVLNFKSMNDVYLCQ